MASNCQELQGNRIIKEKSVSLRQMSGRKELLSLERVPIGLEVEKDGMDEIPEGDEVSKYNKDEGNKKL